MVPEKHMVRTRQLLQLLQGKRESVMTESEGGQKHPLPCSLLKNDFVLCSQTGINCARVRRCAISLPSRHTYANSGLRKRFPLTVVRQAALVPIQSLYQMSQADC